MRTLTRSLLATTAVAGLLALPVAGAGAANPQTIDASVAGGMTIDSTPADANLGTLPVTDAGLGSVQVTANQAYTLNVTANYDTMTGWDGALYDTSRALTSQFLLTTVNNTPLTGGAGLAAVPATTTPTPIATNALTGLLSATDVYDLTATQLSTAADPAGAYRLELTYSVSAGV